jgi:hypothetical protein
MLAIGVYAGFVRHASPAFVFVWLGVTTAVFVSALFAIIKPQAFAFVIRAQAAHEPESKAEHQPAAAVDSQAEIRSPPLPEANTERQVTLPAEAKNGIQSAVQPKPQIEPMGQTPRQAIVDPERQSKAQSNSQANTDAATSMNTTLGDLLLAALRNDPEGAGRIFAQAVHQAEPPLATLRAQETPGLKSA